MSELDPETVAQMAITAAKLDRAGHLLNSVTSAAEGRAVMRQVAQILDSIDTGRPPIDMLRDTSDLNDDQVLSLCHQMAASLAQQSSSLANVAANP